MEKKFSQKIIADNQEGLQTISALISGGKVKVSDLKYLPSSKIFLFLVERFEIENENDNKKLNSICRIDFVSKVKSKNIDQKKQDMVLNLIAMDYMKNKEDFEINLIFDNNSHITLTTETVEVRLEDNLDKIEK